jgi:putative methanogen marker protein 4
LSKGVYSLATSNKAKVAVGLNSDLPSAERVVNSALFAKREGYAEPIFISAKKPESPLFDAVGKDMSLIVDKSPHVTLVELLKEGTVDSAIRGNLASKELIPLLREEFNCSNLCRITLLDIANRLVMLAPVGIDEGDKLEDLLMIAGHAKRLAEALRMPCNVAVISGGRLEDRGRSKKVDSMLSASESLTKELKAVGISAVNVGIEIERAIEGDSTLILAPDGVMGNLIFRSLVLVGNVESFGAYAAALPRVYVDTSRAKGSFMLPIVLASALSKL